MKHQRSRTKIVPGKFTGGSWNADFKGTQLVLPVVDPSKRLRFYTYHTQVMELKQVQGGDESIKPGKLELSLECCQDNHGPAVPPDTEDSVLEAFQATLDAAKAAEGH
ncbi:hypothetical protein CSUI_010873 [Cystoisospora suis]|uniref:Uncharacterized protein n=1 Tax=Cystoisospora suis TaxID=483139 RepID=A0A2C6KG58_9APIC|nr:hypothetical protein CSUI_010873 [Cystoisospora suis]